MKQKRSRIVNHQKLIDHDISQYPSYMRNLGIKADKTVNEQLESISLYKRILHALPYDQLSNKAYATLNFRPQYNKILNDLKNIGFAIIYPSESPFADVGSETTLQARAVILNSIKSTTAELSMNEILLTGHVKEEIISIELHLSHDFYLPKADRGEMIAPDNIDHLSLILNYFNDKTTSLNFLIRQDLVPEVILKAAIPYQKGLNLGKEIMALIDEGLMIKEVFAAESIYDRDFNKNDDPIKFAKMIWKKIKGKVQKLRADPAYVLLQSEAPIVVATL
jgi:hypothetical protein